MARKCGITGKGVQVGHNVSHSNVKTKRRFLPNLQQVSVLSDTVGAIRLRITTAAIRTIEHKGGVDAFLRETPDRKLSPEIRRLKRRVERRPGDVAGVVRDRRCGDCGDHFEEVIFAKTSREESFDVLIVEAPALFDHRFCHSRQRGESAVLWRTTVTNGLHIRRIDPLLERQRRMEGDGPLCRRWSLRR